jgi:hypothetical protein
VPGLPQGDTRVYVEALTGQTHTIYVNLDEAVVVTKRRLYAIRGIPLDQQRLIYDKRQLEDLWTSGTATWLNPVAAHHSQTIRRAA